MGMQDSINKALAFSIPVFPLYLRFALLRNILKWLSHWTFKSGHFESCLFAPLSCLARIEADWKFFRLFRPVLRRH
jgi:hypothetical protein